MKKNQRNVTIVINPSYEGIAYVAYESLNNVLDFGLRKVNRKNKNEFERHIKYLFNFCKPEVVLLLDKSQSKSSRIQWAVKIIKEVAEASELILHQKTSSTIAEAFEVFGIKTKYERFKLLCSWFPMLKKIAPCEHFRFINTHYHTPVFDAFALMVAHEDWKMSK